MGMFHNPGEGGDMGPVKMWLGHFRTLGMEGMLGTRDMAGTTLGPWGLKGHGDSGNTVGDTQGP